MANFVKILQSTLLLCMILSLGMAKRKKCPKNADLNPGKAKVLQNEFGDLTLLCDQKYKELTMKDIKTLKGKDLCTVLKTYFELYIRIPPEKFSPRNWEARSRLMNTMNHTIQKFINCEEGCPQEIGPIASKEIKKIQNINLEKMNENDLCDLKHLFNNISSMVDRRKTAPKGQNNNSNKNKNRRSKSG